MCYDDMEVFIDECLAKTKEKEESILQEWLSKIGYEGTVGYYRNIEDHAMELYTKHPGILIGKAGCHVFELEEMLSRNFSGRWSVKFIEVRGGFVNGFMREENDKTLGSNGGN